MRMEMSGCWHYIIQKPDIKQAHVFYWGKKKKLSYKGVHTSCMNSFLP